MNIDELTLGDLKKLQMLIRCETPAKKMCVDGQWRIVILQRGWVVVGKFFQDGEQCRLERGAVIRVWGTTRGLPELVDGPIKDKTVVDKSSTPIRFHELTIIATIDANGAAWEKVL